MSEILSHRRALELIPWLVNGTLGDDERAALERHVRDCLPCRAELKQQRALAALLGKRHEPHLSPDAAFDALMNRADRRRWAPRARYAIAASIAIALLGSIAVLYIPRLTDEHLEPGYETLARGGDAAVRLDLVFAPDVTETELRGIVRAIGGTLVAGPSEAGRYTIELGDDGTVTLERTIADLRADERVRFAGRSFMPPEGR